ncbi:Gfo/Idh/MocA family oxidoreductase [Litchfieldella rifensis]|uniref:Gfo/Idh/MocA family oxidoreductase n=1 Tax=Litchfieldella rifensis TaxID=762643 RepID=A0ABV7LTD9_9GAMM
MVTRVGMIGHSEGNGHPFSFSAIINGYSEAGLREAGWPVIHTYVSRRHPADFGVGDLRVTHAWTQDPEITRALCRAANIAYAVTHPDDMLGEVHALIIARDDAESHWSLARPFLEAGIPVFIDKPLTLDRIVLEYFVPYLEQGLLMSCSAMRYAMELDELRKGLASYGELKLIRGIILNDWPKYGIHLLEAILSLAPSRPISVRALPARHESLLIMLEDGTPVIIDALGKAPGIFNVELFGSEHISCHSIRDNFTMFRRALWSFATMIRDARPPIRPLSTLDVIRTLIAGQDAIRLRREVVVHAA